MNKQNFLYIGLVSLLFSLCTQLQSCKEDEIDTYMPTTGNALYFERNVMISGTRVRVDTLEVSFSHYVGQDVLEFSFLVKLIGDLLPEDKEYKVEVVKELTTAKPGQYSYPDKLIFHKGVVDDLLNVKIYRDKLEKDEAVVLTLGLVANENFGLGFATYEQIKLRFNNKIVKPLWWINNIELVFFGKYSYKKYSTIVEANPGFISVVGLTQTEIREIALNAKDFISDNNIKEDDGTEMVIPVY